MHIYTLSTIDQAVIEAFGLIAVRSCVDVVLVKHVQEN